MDDNNKQVFISYSRLDYLDDQNHVITDNAISRILDAFNEAGISYWIDKKGIYTGDEFVPLISKAIKTCDIFLFISSEASNASEWTSNEIAAAHMFKKKIIPFRIDDSIYNDSIIMFIAKLDFIDYLANEEKAISRLVSSVQEYLKMVEIKRKRDEQKKDEERKKREQEQKKLIADIEIAAKELDNVERDAELKRRRLMNSVQNVENETERNRLQELIENSGPIYSINKKYEEEIARLTKDLDEARTKEEKLVQELDETKGARPIAHLDEFKSKYPMLYVGYTYFFAFLFFVIIVLLCCIIFRSKF